MAKVFLSYSRQDEAFVRRLYERLERDGVECFFDKESIDWGSNWVLELDKGISEAEKVVLVLTPEFCRSVRASDEWASAKALATSNLDSAVSGLRRAGQQHMLVLGLLTRAWQRGVSPARAPAPTARQATWTKPGKSPPAAPCRSSSPTSTCTGQDSLFGARNAERENRNKEENYPWESPQHDLAEVRHLIEKYGYLRRLPELEDAEAALHPLTNEPTP